MTKILIAGCGYVGRRLLPMLAGDERQTEMTAVVGSAVSQASLQGRVATALQIDLDQPVTLQLPEVAELYYFIPPPSQGDKDTRLPRFLDLMDPQILPRRIVMISTSGVYGDCAGEWVDESRPPAPQVDRARRRLDAEQTMRAWCDRQGVECIVLRVAGIYGPDRLPVARLQKGLPMVDEAEAPWSNRIHVDDLVMVCQAAMKSGEVGAVYNVSDGHPGNMTDYFNQVADMTGLPRPPVIRLADAQGRLSAGLLSYLRESRRLDNRKMLGIPGVLLRYPTLDAGLHASV